MMKFRQGSHKLTPFFALAILLIVSWACGTSSSEVAPTTDPGVLQTAIIGTAAEAQLLTLTAGAPEQRSVPLPTSTIASSETPIPTLEQAAMPTLIDGAVIQIKVVNKASEYVDLDNIGSQPQDSTGWSLVSERGNQACILSGVILPGATLRIWANNSNDEGYNCNYGSEIWNNSEADPAVLYNNQGQEVARYP